MKDVLVLVVAAFLSAQEKPAVSLLLHDRGAGIQYSVTISSGAETQGVARVGGDKSRSGEVDRTEVNELLDQLDKLEVTKIGSTSSGVKNDGYQFSLQSGDQRKQFNVYWDQVKKGEEKPYRDVLETVRKFCVDHSKESEK